MSTLITYWEHFNSSIKIADLFLEQPQEYYFPKKRNTEKYKCLGVYPETNGLHKIELSYFIGVDWIVTNEKAIYVAPKINTKLKEDGTPDNNISFEDIQQTDYLKMLFSALKHPDVANHTDELFEIKWNDPQIEITQQQDLLTPLLVVQFLRIVKEIVRKGLKKSYYKVEQNLYSKVKGKILVGQTIKQNLLKNKPLNTFCSYDEFGLNGIENRLLKKTLVFVQRYLPTLANLHHKEYSTDIFNYINPAFEFVSEDVNLNDIKHSKTNAFYKEYEVAIRLAKLILKRFGYNINNTLEKSIKTPPFWIDMSKLFELYVLGQLKDKYGNEILYGRKEAKAYYGLPDFLLTKEGEKTIIDTKYKPIYQENKYDIENIRQLSGYGRDTGVLSKLGFKTPEEQNIAVVKCLIIYPDQSTNENLWENVETEIEGFVKFKKQPIRLPLLKNGS
jgi:5-methylcytosine-specific restriction enzyme subunit McrC